MTADQSAWADAATDMPRVSRRDLTNAGGTFTRERAMSIRPCAHCKRGIHVGQDRINHRPVVTSSVTDFFHIDCVVIP